MIGATFGRLTVVALAANQGARRAWACVCECGGAKSVTTTALRTGRTASCGCLRREAGLAKTTHGESRSPEYASWVAMIHRCENPERGDYPYYGGRGIKVCQAWHEFSAFLADMGRRPTIAHTLERRRNAEGYSPDNCYWATKSEQSSNTRRNVLVEHRGRTQTVAAWAKETGVPYNTLLTRIKAGWPTDRALKEVPRG